MTAVRGATTTTTRAPVVMSENNKLAPCAQPENDPSFAAASDGFGAKLARDGGGPMPNIVAHPNDGRIVSKTAGRDAPKVLLELTEAAWRLEDRPTRRVALIVIDMQKEYAPYVDYVLPQCEALVTAFRAARRPVVWTNWAHRADDGWYSAADRVIGAGGIEDASNPQYTWSRDGAETIASLAPRDDEERAREIMSIHANKFADRDADGNPILYPMLKALDVDTVVLVGAWTDYCVAATAMAASDSWGFDCVTVTDAVASANVISDDASHSGLDVTNLFGRNAPSREVLDFLERS
mmetsp:Transcript_22667/g.67885  ORF Transcript_22667/g.67885 Transcript_22667/m.67885 type:complete len:295 (+) Transcript_22667:478-1362(+)